MDPEGISTERASMGARRVIQTADDSTPGCLHRRMPQPAQPKVVMMKGEFPYSGTGFPKTKGVLLGSLGLMILGLSGCATFSGHGAPTLQEEIDAIVSAPPLDQLHWGILIRDAESGRALYSLNAHRKFVPASNMKVLSTSTALSLLGPDHRFETEITGSGAFDRQSGLLDGDLVVHPGGDPTLSERFYPTATAPLDSLAQDLWEAGIRSVSGSLVVDASSWDSTTVPSSWMVGNLSSSSGATGSALAIGEGEIQVEVTAGPRVGDPATVRWWPSTPPDFFSASFLTTQPDSSRQREISYLPESRRLFIEGMVRLGETDTISIAQRDPAGVAAEALLSSIEARGIRVDGGLRMAWIPEDLPRVEIPSEPQKFATLISPPLGEIVEAILEPSQNWMTEQLVHVLGLELGEEGSWAGGFEVERDFLSQEVGIDTLDIHYRDGSGLSAYNLVTPRAMVRIFEYMQNSPHGELYRLALAEPGEEGSTLSNRLPGLEGRVFAKTGTISHVNSLSGYLTTESGRRVIFSILTNGSGVSSGLVRSSIDRVVQVVARR